MEEKTICAISTAMGNSAISIIRISGKDSLNIVQKFFSSKSLNYSQIEPRKMYLGIFENGNIKEVHCTYDVNTKSGSGFNERKPNGTIQFVEATTARKAKFNMFEPLLMDSDDDSKSFMDLINPNSWNVLEGFVENAKDHFEDLEKFQFIRDGYYTVDKESRDDALVFNCIVPLKSSAK